jgi:hypothetical protein
MRRSSVAIFLAILLATLTFAVDIQHNVTKKTPLKGELEDLVVFGLLKEMTCERTVEGFTKLPFRSPKRKPAVSLARRVSRN